MKFTSLLFIVVLCFGSIVHAQMRQDKRTVAYVNAFTRRVNRHDKRHRRCIHTINVAQEHLRIWQQWRKTRRWPKAADAWRDNNVPAPKPNATSVVRVSMYGRYNDGASQIEADNHGRVGVFGTRYDMGPYEGTVFYLKPKQMNELQRLLRRPPRSRRVTNWADIIMISGRRNGRWFMRMYSRKHQPKTVRQILGLLKKQPIRKPVSRVA